MVPTLIMLGYNVLAFGSPWEMGYFHHATREFAEVHSAQHPLGLAFPESFWEGSAACSGAAIAASVLCADLAADSAGLDRTVGSPLL